MRKRVSRSIDIERALAQALARREALLDEDERALPSEDLLALFAGTATSAERSRLIGAPAGRAAVRAILAQAEGGERRQRGAARLAAWAPRVAAAVLLGLVLWQAGRSTDDGTVCRTVAALEARDFDLADALWTRPDEERGTWSPRSSMLRAPAAPTPRLQVAAPLCRSLLARPVLRWQAPRAAGPFHVSLEDAGGRTLLAAVVSGTSLAW
ncbi:MAG: hypothetical protein HY812_14925, partial [Planctomycetes bacterium]|nr:hypothetical protein [Planctomycetota bacterium]